MKTFLNLIAILSPPLRRRVCWLSAWLMATSVLEVLSVAVILPYLRLLSSPASFTADLAQWGVVVPASTSIQALVVGGTLFVLTFFLLKSLFTLQMRRTLYRFLYGTAADYSQSLFTYYLQRPYEVHLNCPPAELTRTIADDVPNAFTSYMYAWMTLISEAVVGLGLLILMLVVAPLPSLVSLGLLGSCCGFLVARMRHAVSRAGRMHVTARGEVLQRISEGLGGIKEVQIWQTADLVGGTLGNSCRKWSDAQRLEVFLRAIPRTFGEPLLVLGVLVCVIVLVMTTADPTAFLPTIALFAMASFRILPMLTTLTNVANKIRFHGPATKRVVQELNSATTETSPTSAAPVAGNPLRFEYSLELRGVMYTYPRSDTPVLAGISLTIQPGDAIAVMGSSGSGKTTFINLILGLLTPQQGDILVDGESIHDNMAGWRALLAYIPQDVYIFQDTIRSNVRMGCTLDDPDERRTWQSLEQAQLADFVRSLPSGLDTPLSDRGANFSGGQRQRLGIARALYRDASVLVLDEATSALDREIEAQLTETMRRLVGTKTILVITHRPEAASFCPRTIVLDRGQLLRDTILVNGHLPTPSKTASADSLLTADHP